MTQRVYATTVFSLPMTLSLQSPPAKSCRPPSNGNIAPVGKRVCTATCVLAGLQPCLAASLLTIGCVGCLYVGFPADPFNRILTDNESWSASQELSENLTIYDQLKIRPYSLQCDLLLKPGFQNVKQVGKAGKLGQTTPTLNN